MSIWTDFGFSNSLYETTPIQPSEEGERLLVGRTKEISQLRSRIVSSALHTTIEGENGIGKTSLVSVVSYKIRRDFKEGRTSEPFFPAGPPFQLDPNDTLESLTRRVLYQVAQAFIDNRGVMRMHGYPLPEIKEIDRWLNSPLFRSGGGGVTLGLVGGSGNRASSPNESVGFSDAGFARAVTEWLRDCFPTRQAGGFICVIDNLELLETTRATRSLLEAMRDSLLDLPGLRWVLCGARGIVRSAASSPRLEGRLGEPMDLHPIADSVVDQVIAERVHHYKVASDAVAPVGPEGFRDVYDVLNQNLRSALKFCEDFSFWLHERPELPWTDKDNRAHLEIWMTDKADEYLSATHLAKRAWTLFDAICAAGRDVSPSEFAAFNFQSQQAMRPQVKALEDASLVVSTIDEDDARRRTISVTPRGWLVRYARSEYQPHAL